VNEGDGLQGAESLYLIVAFGLEDADALSHFSQSDIGDIDGDGLNEFLDGWGRPISFLRWPAGFESPRQSRDANKDFDQFNPRRIVPDRVLTVQPRPAQGMPRQFALYPLIYSGGPDQKKDIQTGTVDRQVGKPPHYCVRVTQSPPAGYVDLDFVDPYLPLEDQGLSQVGQPFDDDDDGSLDHGDNIHNHNLTIR
jgi:hypothetical protein